MTKNNLQKRKKWRDYKESLKQHLETQRAYFASEETDENRIRKQKEGEQRLLKQLLKILSVTALLFWLYMILH